MPTLVRFPDCDVFRVPVGPGTMHVERYGYGGAPIVLVHGFGTTSFLWRHVGPQLAVHGCSAYAVDMFGYGASDRPFEADYGVRAQAGYLALALEQLHLSAVTIAACDVGALVSLFLAATYPEAVGRMVLVSPASSSDLPGPDIRLMQRETATNVFRLVRGLFGAQPLIALLLENAVANASVLTPRLLGRYVAPYVGREGVNHFLALARSLENDDLSEFRLADVQHPALVVHGQEDRWFSADEAARLAADLPRGSSAGIAAAGRLVPEDAPESLVSCILRHQQDDD